MKILKIIVILILKIIIANANDIKIITVPQNCHYPGCLPHAPVYSTNPTQNILVSFTRSNLEYADIPGFDCATCWNKLFGKTRCNKTIHQDSDRFVWRAGQNRTQVQIAAYSYESGVNPYNPPNPDLLKIFDTLLDIDKFYLYQIIFEEDQTIFNLYDENQKELIENKVIQHRFCQNYNKGFDSGFYFGGHSVAPIDVSVFYQYIQDQEQQI